MSGWVFQWKPFWIPDGESFQKAYLRCAKRPLQNFGRHQKGDASSQAYRFNNSISNRSPVQRRLSIYNWNPGPRRGKENAFEKQIAGKWHVITLQEASDFVDHDILTNRFHVTHFGRCAVLFNKDTFYPDIEVKSIHLHDTRRDLLDQVMEAD